MPRLASINIRANDNSRRNRIEFCQDYTLRPSQGGAYIQTSLTLNRVDMFATRTDEKMSTYFYYDTPNPGVDLRQYRVDLLYKEPILLSRVSRDPWGYYSKDASAWSLSRVSLPGSKTIEWKYEPKRFHYLNGEKFSGIGDGIRVKKIKISEAMGSNYLLDYFYTNKVGLFDENESTFEQSSGVVSAVPVNYSKYDGKKGKGGIYTPVKVTYEMVQVVKDFDHDNLVAPNGFKVFEFYTNRQFPNEGEYGTIDNSWKTGHLKSSAVYNSLRKLISKSESSFDFVEKYRTQNLYSGGFNTKFANYERLNCGSVLLKNTKTFQKGVAQERVFYYSNNGFGNSSEADKVTSTMPNIEYADVELGELPVFSIRTRHYVNNIYAVTNSVDGDDLSSNNLELPDAAIVRIFNRFEEKTSFPNHLIIDILRDIQFSEEIPVESTVKSHCFSKIVDDDNCEIDLKNSFITGVDFVDYDNDDELDLILQGVNGQVFFYYIIRDVGKYKLPDFNIDNVTYIDQQPTLPSGYIQTKYTSSAIGHFTGEEQTPDILYSVDYNDNGILKRLLIVME